MATQSRRTGSIRRFLHHWFRRETAAFVFKVAVVAGLLLTVSTQDGPLSLDFSLRLFIKILLTVLVLYIVASFSAARACMESAAHAYLSKRSGRLGVE